MGGLNTKYLLQIFNQMLKSTKHGLQEKVQVSKDPEKVQKGWNAIFFISVHIYIIWALCLKQESNKKVKWDRSYGVHKVGTVDDIL